jgi:hypothetical protein
MVHFDVIETLSLAGDVGGANDDRAGASDRLAWVIDGATDLGEPGLLGPRGGAAWIAAEADRTFTAATARDLGDICKAVFDGIANSFMNDRTRDPIGAWELPSAALLAVTLNDGELDLAWLGDCTGFIIGEGAPRRIGPAPQVRDRESMLAESLAEHGLGRKERAAPVLSTLRHTRANPERAVLGVDPAGIARMKRGRAPCQAGDDVILMTDGFAAITDLYGLMTPDELAGSLRNDGLVGIARRLREAEAADAACIRWPRFKRGDDATAIWLRIG